MIWIFMFSLCLFSFVRNENIQTDSRISHGVFARRGEVPYIALLNWNNGRDEFICGGTIIGPKHILTSSFCTSNILEEQEDDVSIYVGTVYRSGSKGDLHKISRIFNHPDYNPTSYHNDISVIRLASNINFTEYVQPINITTTTTKEDTLVRASGWGLTELSLPAFQLKYSTYMIQGLCHITNSYFDEVKQMCGSAGRAELTAGDTGGPIIYEGNLIGVISKNGAKSGCCENKLYFTRVLYYSDWIQQTLLK